MDGSRRHDSPPTYARASWLFLRLLGLAYVLAFWSLGTQVLGLIGHDGILPADRYLTAAREVTGAGRFWLLPTLAWISSSDAFLRALCSTGVVLASLLTLGVLPIVMLPLLWLLYLSLSIVGGEFLSYQWDALLLEAGFLAIFVAPPVWRERLRGLTEPPRVAVWLLLWLLFRLMLGSGLVKLLSGDPTWSDLTALTVHFETQPIPTPLAWYAHWLSPMALKMLTGAVLAIEIGGPFVILAPRRWRPLGFAVLAGLQVIIALTGNYAFFNLLTIALCVFLLDDEAIGRWGTIVAAPARTIQLRRSLVLAAAIVVVPPSILTFTRSLGIELPGARIADPLVNWVEPFRSVSSYGLFAVMTTTRPEIVVEGSADGTTWLEYEFKYKAGDLHRRPPWVAPHQPRLDWQMWFAALGRFETERWFQAFCGRLLDADPTVLRLLERDPFAGQRPKYLRAILYRYRFADSATRRRDGVWWTRERLGAYSPELESSSTRER